MTEGIPVQSGNIWDLYRKSLEEYKNYTTSGTLPTTPTSLVYLPDNQGTMFQFGNGYVNPAARQYSFWERPQAVVRYYNLLRSVSPDWQAPSWLDKDSIYQAYDYLKFRNGDTPVEQWQPLAVDDPGTSFLQNIGTPPNHALLPSEYAKYGIAQQTGEGSPLTDAQVKAQQPIDWSDLDNPEYKWMRTYLSLFAPQAEGIENRPELSKLSASAVQSIMLSLGAGVAVGSFTGPVGGVIAGLAAAGLLTYQNYTGNKVPLLNDLMRPFNWLAEGAEATIGMASLAKKEGYDEVFDSLESAYRTGLLEYETWKASNIPNWIAGVDDALRPNVDITTAGKNQVWKISSGNLKPVEAPYGKGGEALAHYHQWIESGQANDEYQAALETGYDGRYQEFIYQRVMEEYGDTAISNDIVWQTVLDPLNVLPWAIGKSGGAIAGKIASTADNATVARTAGQIEGAFKQGTGNILIDALPPGIQQIAEAITGVQSSKGLLQTYNLYKDWIRTGFIPANMKQHAPDLQAKYKQLLKDGVKQTDISILDDTLTWTDKRGVRQSWQGKQGATIEAPTWDDLSAFEKYVGGLDEEYGYKELRPTFGKSFVKRLSKLTPEAQVNAIMNIFHHNIATLMDAAGGDPVKMTDLIERMAGNVTMKKGDTYSDIINSPANKAVIQAMQYAMKDGDFVTNMLSQWTLGEERRMMLNKIAAALEEKVSDVIEMAKDKPEILSQRMNKIAPELNTTPDVLKETLKVFIGDDALPWTAEQFQANLVNTFAQKMDNFFIERYGLKPEAKVFRISNALKGVQSLVLLGFNPAYLMNNWINNFVTRSVDGVGGYLSPKQVNDFYTRFGIFPKDSGLTGFDEITGRVMREATQAKDMIAKAQKGITALNKIGIFSRLSGRIEKLEGGQARVVAMKDFMGKTKKVGEGIRRMPLVLENALDSRYPGMKEKVYAAIGAGLNIKEIESSLFTTEVKPQVENLIDQLDQRYRTGQGGSVRELFDKMNLTDNLRDELMNAKTDMEIDLAFKNVEDRLTDMIEKAHAEELFTLSEESKNLTQSERIPYVLSVHGDMIIDEAMKHITGRQAWEVLYAKKMAGQFTPEQWTKEVKYLDAKQRAEMKRTNERRLQTYKGIIQSMGIDNESSRTFVIKLGEFNDVWKTYWDGRARLYDEYYQTIDKRKGETWEQRNSRIDGLYEKLQEQQEKLYDAAVKAELAIQTDMDTMFAKMYEDYTGWDVTPAVKGRADLRKMREEMTNMQKEMRKTTKGLTPDQIDAEYAKMNPVYNQIIAKMKQFEHDLSYKLMNKPVPEVRIEVPVVEKPVVVPEPEGNPNLEPITPADLTINPDNLALLKEEAINAGMKPELADGLDARGLSNYINEMKARETRAAKGAEEQAKINKMKEVVKAKTVAEDIFAQADRVLKEKATHAELVRNKADYLAQTRKAYKNVSEEQFTLFEELVDRWIDRWAERNGYTPSDEIRNAWYATRIDKVTRETGNLPPEAVNSTAKGAYEMLENARAVITALEKADFSTMVHEMFHVFLPDLSDADIDSVAKLGGLKNGAELLDLMNQVRTGALKRGMPDFKRYEDCVEQFARGGEQYIASGDAPTPALKSLFRKFSDWMLEIYQALTRKNGRVTGYENTPLKVNINVKVDGVSLKDIFDRMLTDKVDRPPTFEKLVLDRFEALKSKGRTRVQFNDAQITDMARKEIVSDMLSTWKNAEEANKFLEGMTDYHTLKDGTLIDDATLYDALNYAQEHPEASPWTGEVKKIVAPLKEVEVTTPKGDTVHAKYVVMELDDLIASDDWFGGTVNPNPKYNQDLQGRIRSEKSSIAWMVGRAKPEKFEPKLVLMDSPFTDRGTPIITKDNMVWSGNGRVNTIRYGIEQNLGTYEKYRASLDEYAAQRGIEPATYADMQKPVLVREITDDLTTDQLVKYASDTNKSSSASMTGFENSVNDAARITDEALESLNILDTGTGEGLAGVPARSEGIQRVVGETQPTGQPQPAVKQPWEMTRAEYTESASNEVGYSGLPLRTLSEINRAIKESVARSNALQKAENKAIDKLIKDGKTPQEAWSIWEETQGYKDFRTPTPDLNKVTDAYLSHKEKVEQALAEGKPVPPEVLKDYPDLVAKNVVSTQAKAEYDAGKPVPIDRAQDIDLAHEEVMPVPEEITKTVTEITESFKFDKKQQAKDYVDWILGGERGPRPDVSQDVIDAYAGQLGTLREQAAQQASGVVTGLTQEVLDKKGTIAYYDKAKNNYYEYLTGKVKINGEYAGTTHFAYFMDKAQGNKMVELGQYASKKDAEAAIYEHYAQVSTGKPGINIQKVYKFTHGDTPCVANVYKDGELIAYVPEVPLKDMRLDENTRILGLDPQFPDKIVYEQDGVIKTVDSRKPTPDQSQLYQSGQTDFFSQSNEDLPLFSGTPMRAEDQAFRPRETGGQASLFPDIVPEAKPTRIIEIAIKEKNATSYLRFDLRKTKAIRDTLALHKGEDMTARILDANGKVIESNVDPNQVVNPTGSNMLFQDTQTATKDWYFSQLGKVLEGMPNKMTPEALRGYLNGKVKPSEMEWTGFEKWISQQEGQVTKQDALDYIAENQVRVEEVVHGGEEDDVSAWWNDEGGANEETPFEDLTPAERADAISRYRDEVEDYSEEGIKYGTYTLPGGENYRELLLTLPNPKTEGDISTIEGLNERARAIQKRGGQYQSPHWSEPNVLAHIRFDDRIDADGKRVLFIEEIQSDWHQAGRERGYIHAPTENDLPDGWKIENIDISDETLLKQFANDNSGWKFKQEPDGLWYIVDPKGEASTSNHTEKAAAVRELYGFEDYLPSGTWWVIRNETGNIWGSSPTKQGVLDKLTGMINKTNPVPPAPFSKNWDELAIKRAIRYAAENGYERVAWTTGKMQADRYNLAKQVDRLEWYKFGSAADEWELTGVKDGKQILHEVISESKLPDYVGKDIAAKLIAKEKTGTYDNGNEYSYVEGEADLSVGGEGMKGFYDIKLPEIIKKYIKKWGATVGETDIRAGDNREVQYTNGVISGMTENTALTRVQSFDITPAMRDAVVYQGQPLFQDGFTEAPGATEQFREYNEAPIDVQRMSDAPMGEVPLNGTPVTEPFSRTLDEINSEHLRPMMDELKDMYKKAMKEDTPFKFGDLTDEEKKAVRKYLDNDVRSDLASVKRAALSYGDMMRNNAMLDYGRRYGFDNVLGTVFPYQFWYTRSMMNWAKRMVDKPSWFAMYARMKQAQERMEQENMPTRLRGKMRINMPWMPEWMGGGLWTDPMSKVFPFEQFGQPFEQYAMNKNQLNKAAEYIIEDMRSSEKITAAEAEQAINTKQGTIWERALAQAEIEEGKSASPASLAGMMMQPALWWQIPLNMANPNRDQVGPLPITRTGQTIKELGSNTFLQPVTNLIGGALAAPETAIRKSKGLSEFGQWGDYYIDRTIAGMAADGEITADQARIAMIQRTGDVFTEATKRVSQEQALRTPGAAGIMALKEGKIGQALPAFIASMFGGSLFSEGEMKMRGLKPIYDNAWKKYEAGDDEAINQFFEDYPEYEARLALYDEPDDRLHQFLIDSIWRKYMELDKENKRLAVDALGEDFELSFLNKETRSYDTIDDKTLAKWSAMLGKSEMPEVEATQEAQTTKPISTYDQQMLSAINAYKTEKESQFSGIYMWQEAYFNLPAGAQRKAFLQQHPQLKAYWEWKDEYAQAHPEIAPYFEELQQSSIAAQASSELTSPLIRQILTLATGGTLSAGAKNELERIRQQIAPEMSEEQFIQIVLALVLSQ